MHIKNAVVLVTGANRGLGRAFVNALLEAGAAKIYAAARNPSTTTLQGVVPIQLDITSETDMAAAAAQCKDATVDVLSVTSWLNFRSAATYSASKSAVWSLTHGLRSELKSQGNQVVGVHVGLMDTDMARGFDVPKADPLEVARQTLVAIAEGKEEVLADDLSRKVKQGLSAGAYLAQVE